MLNLAHFTVQKLKIWSGQNNFYVLKTVINNDIPGL